MSEPLTKEDVIKLQEPVYSFVKACMEMVVLLSRDNPLDIQDQLDFSVIGANGLKQIFPDKHCVRIDDLLEEIRRFESQKYD